MRLRDHFDHQISITKILYLLRLLYYGLWPKAHLLKNIKIKQNILSQTKKNLNNLKISFTEYCFFYVYYSTDIHE